MIGKRNCEYAIENWSKLLLFCTWDMRDVHFLRMFDVQIQICIDMYIYIYIHAHIHTYLPTYLHTYIHTHIYIYIYIYINLQCSFNIPQLWGMWSSKDAPDRRFRAGPHTTAKVDQGTLHGYGVAIRLCVCALDALLRCIFGLPRQLCCSQTWWQCCPFPTLMNEQWPLMQCRDI